MIIVPGLRDEDRARAVSLYWQAFGGKLGRVLGPEPKAMAFIGRVLDPSHAISARDAAGQLIGVAGFKTHLGGFVGGGFSDLRAIYGLFGALWRAALLALLERDVENERFLMDGIFVDASARGQGVGTKLLDAVAREAHERGYREVRLDVIDSNFRARALYLRCGFTVIGTSSIGPLSLAFGFRSATTMVRRVS